MHRFTKRSADLPVFLVMFRGHNFSPKINTVLAAIKTVLENCNVRDHPFNMSSMYGVGGGGGPKYDGS